MGHFYEYIPPEMDQAIRSWIRRHRRGLKIGCLISLILGFFLVIAVVWAAIWGAGHLKNYLAGKTLPNIPIAWEQKLGDSALAQIQRTTRFINAPQVLEPINRLAEPLFNGISNSPYQFRLLVSDATEVNACALPGGTIIFNQGLLERAKSPQEIQGILAHEMAHILKRHSLVQLAKNTGLGVIVQALSGNENRYLDALIQDGATLISLKFSRDDERSADDMAWDLLQKARMDPRGMVDFFAGLKAEMDVGPTGNFGVGFSLLSTHPTPQERIDRLQQKAAILDTAGFKSFDSDFKNLQLGLHGPSAVESSL